MATYEIKKEGGVVKVKVTVAALPSMAKAARKAKEVVRPRDVERYLNSQGIETSEHIQGKQISNFAGPEITEEFIFALKGASPPIEAAAFSKPVKNILTSEVDPAIIRENVKTSNKRKRSNNDSPSKRTTETSE